MGLFKRSNRWPQEIPQPPSTSTPIDKSTINIATARSVTEALCVAIGDNDRMWQATRRLMHASGMPDPDNAHQVMEAHRREGRYATTKLWRWLVAVAEHANDIGEHHVAAMAYYWATNWIYGVQPTLGGHGAIQLGFDASPAGTHAALVREAERALAQLPEDFVVAQTSEPATVTAGAAALVVAEQSKAGGELAPDAAVQRAINEMKQKQASQASDVNRL